MLPLLLIDFRHDKINTSPFDSLEGFEWISGTKLRKLVLLQSAIWQDQRFVSFLMENSLSSFRVKRQNVLFFGVSS